MPVSREKEERMWALAEKLAMSGGYDGWWAIEVELRALGYARARYLLDDDDVRQQFDRMCAEARR